MAVKTYGRRSHDCRCAPRSAVSICLAVPLIVGFLVSLGICVYHVYEANEDRRSELVAAYDSSVEAWTAGDAETYAEKWTGEAALPLPSLTVDRDDPNHVDGTFTFGVFQSGDEALGALRDAEPDYLRYDQGTVLQTTIENFFDDSRRVGVEDVRFVVGNTTVRAEAIVCRVDEYCDGAESADNPNSGSSGQTCETRYHAGVAFLQSVTFVDLSGDADAFLGVEARANACAFEYTSFIGGEPFSSRAEAHRLQKRDGGFELRRARRARGPRVGAGAGTAFAVFFDVALDRLGGHRRVADDETHVFHADSKGIAEEVLDRGL